MVCVADLLCWLLPADAAALSLTVPPPEPQHSLQTERNITHLTLTLSCLSIHCSLHSIAPNIYLPIYFPPPSPSPCSVRCSISMQALCPMLAKAWYSSSTPSPTLLRSISTSSAGLDVRPKRSISRGVYFTVACVCVCVRTMIYDHCREIHDFTCTIIDIT